MFSRLAPTICCQAAQDRRTPEETKWIAVVAAPAALTATESGFLARPIAWLVNPEGLCRRTLLC
jgi:hypothetical protein